MSQMPAVPSATSAAERELTGISSQMGVRPEESNKNPLVSAQIHRRSCEIDPFLSKTVPDSYAGPAILGMGGAAPTDRSWTTPGPARPPVGSAGGWESASATQMTGRPH